MTMAQACLESGYGKYAPGNNMFGIKWTSGCGYRSQSQLTTEYINGALIKVYASFRTYDSLSDSLFDHAQFLIENSRYANLLGVKDYKTACKLIQQDGYATAPNYGNQLIEIIEENELYQYDMEVDIMDKIVLYYGDADLFAAVIVSQKEKCPVMLYQDFKDKGLKANKVIQIGGPGASAGGANRFETFKAAANLI
jgi:hypothetical protein